MADTLDIVEHLRGESQRAFDLDGARLDEAADEIERLREFVAAHDVVEEYLTEQNCTREQWNAAASRLREAREAIAHA